MCDTRSYIYVVVYHTCMPTPAISARLRPVLMARIKDELDAGRADNRTEIIERGLCQYFGLDYVQIGVKRSKGV